MREMMKFTMSGVAVILYLLVAIHLAAARFLPSKQHMMGENWTVTRREANSDPNSNQDDNIVSEVAQFQTELLNLSMPSYLKDLYINLAYTNRVAQSSSNHEEIKVNTIHSYENQAKSKFKLLVTVVTKCHQYYTLLYDI